jgi:phage-related protein
MGNSPSSPRPIRWIGSSRRDLAGMPDEVRRRFGFALYEVQRGGTPDIAKPMKGLGAGVFELREWLGPGTYRAVYAVQLKRGVYVLHVFQKKSKTGIATPARDIALIESRLRAARALDD